MAGVMKLVGVIGALVVGVASLLGCTGSTAEVEPVAGEPGGTGSSASAVEGEAYTVECGRRIAGAERYVRASSADIVSWKHGLRHDPLDGDGMSDSLDSYSFSGLAPGVVDVQVYDVLSWVDGEQVVDTMRLAVDDELDVERIDTVMAERFELRESGTVAGTRVYCAEPSEAGFLLVSCYWEGYDGERTDERSLNVTPGEVWGAFIDNQVLAWDGFAESEDGVLDGYGFSFEALLSDGTTISAHGSNASPGGYRGFEDRISALVGA